MGTSTRDDAMKQSKRENYPGPGNYNHKSDAQGNTPSYKFGSESRNKQRTNYTPGPGQYHIPFSMMDVPRYITSGTGFNEQSRYI